MQTEQFYYGIIKNPCWLDRRNKSNDKNLKETDNSKTLISIIRERIYKF